LGGGLTQQIVDHAQNELGMSALRLDLALQ
jgi:hypothetical protein